MQLIAAVATTLRGHDMNQNNTGLLCKIPLTGECGALPLPADKMTHHLAHASALLTHLLD